MTYTITFVTVNAVPLAGTLEYYNSAGVKQGSTTIPVTGADIDSSSIPTGTVLYRGVVPGYTFTETANLVAISEFQFIKETPVAKYIAIAGAILIGGYLANKYLKL